MQRTGKTAMVTGASAGLGVHFARLFARDGHDVVLVARRRDKLDEVAAELRTMSGTHAAVIAADLADPQAPGTSATRSRGPASRWTSWSTMQGSAPVARSSNSTSSGS